MNIQFFQGIGMALLLGTTVATAQVVTGNELVRIEVRVASDQDRKDLAKTTADAVTQHRTLAIALSGKAKTPETRTGKWIAYGRSLKGNDIEVLDSGEFKVDLASGVQKIESKKINADYTPAHTTVSTTRGRSTGGKSGTSRTTAKKVSATGTKFIGFSVVVKDGDKIVGEHFDPAGLKAELAK